MSVKPEEKKEPLPKTPENQPTSSKLGSKDDMDEYIKECFKDAYCKDKMAKTIDEDAEKSYQHSRYKKLDTTETTHTILKMIWYVFGITIGVVLIILLVWGLGFMVGWFVTNPFEYFMTLIGVNWWGSS